MNFPFIKNLKGDIFGGLTAGIVALPLALAFGIQAFGAIDVQDVANIGAIGALAGLVGAMMLGFFASLFGGTPSQISGPTGPMTVISASLISAAWAGAGAHSISTVLIAMAVAGILCGLFQILFGVLGIGKYIRYIPYPVLSGFMSGIGIIIILQQIYPLLGLKSPIMIIDMITQLPSKISGIDFTALLLGLGTIAIIYLFPLLTKKIPSTLVALIVMTCVSLLFKDFKLIIGEIPSGLPMPFFLKEGFDSPTLEWATILKMSIIPGLTLAGLGCIDTLLTSVVADNITKTKHNSNRELIGQGIGNMMAGLFCGIPGAGATMRTVVNVKSGGRTRLSGMIHALFLLAILLGLGRFVKYVPLSVLSGILITVGISIIDFKGLKDIFKIPHTDAVVLITVLLLTVFVDLLIAVGIGMIIACVLFMKRISDMVENNYEAVTVDPTSQQTSNWQATRSILPEIRKHTHILSFVGPIFFGTITKLQEVAHSIPKNTKTVIIRMRLVPFIDQSGLYAIETAIKDLQEKGITFLITIIQPQPMYMLKRTKLIPSLIPEEHIFDTYDKCTDYVNESYNKKELFA